MCATVCVCVYSDRQAIVWHRKRGALNMLIVFGCKKRSNSVATRINKNMRIFFIILLRLNANARLNVILSIWVYVVCHVHTHTQRHTHEHGDTCHLANIRNSSQINVQDKKEILNEIETWYAHVTGIRM